MINPASQSSSADPYRVMLVDDSAVIRGLLARALETDPQIQIVSSVGNGEMALHALKRHEVDVVVLDIEMPVMDGLTALPKIIEMAPHSRVIMASTLTKKNADISLRALSAGAADYIPKPSSTRDIHGADDFRRELVAKVRALGFSSRQEQSKAQPGGGNLRRATPAPMTAPAPNERFGFSQKKEVVLRPLPAVFRPEILAIGSSTGGPQALFDVLTHLRDVRQPIVVTQHMPATFTTILAEHITRQCQLPAKEGADGDVLRPGHVYIAPGNYHMLLYRDNNQVVIKLSQTQPENFCRPSVDPMMRSLIALYGPRILGLILTGMGHDGLESCRQLVEKGGAVYAQDEKTSVVWGMPGAVAQNGLCSSVLPISEIGPQIRNLLNKVR